MMVALVQGTFRQEDRMRWMLAQFVDGWSHTFRLQIETDQGPDRSKSIPSRLCEAFRPQISQEFVHPCMDIVGEEIIDSVLYTEYALLPADEVCCLPQVNPMIYSEADSRK